MSNNISISKIVVFDLDETLGYFTELGMFWDAFKSYSEEQNKSHIITQQLFNDILDLYPEFLRPNIMKILRYLKKKKIQNCCDKIMIYTNNQAPFEWVNYIITYFETKLDYKLFDQIISAFKIQGKQVELCRTSNLKTHSDFIKCTKLPINTQICFLDDVFYPDMHNDNIYYINVKPYIYNLQFNEMISRFTHNTTLKRIISDTTYYQDFMTTYMNDYDHTFVPKSREDQNIDIIITKKIIYHLHVFFKMKQNYLHTNKTHKHTHNKHTHTHKTNAKTAKHHS